MPLEEQKEVAVNRYVDLMRIKAHETGENKELDDHIFWQINMLWSINFCKMVSESRE